MRLRLSGLICLLVATPLWAGASTVNLVEAYKAALAFDPTFKKAHADWLTQKENLPLAMTGNGAPGSGLFPNINLTAGLTRNYIQPQGFSFQHYDSTQYQITLTQPIFNLATWESIGVANYTVKAATASYLAASQDLMNRVIDSYFTVLKANAALQTTLTEKKMVHEELSQAKAKNKVGIIAKTDVYNAQAKYDQIIATEIQDRNTLQNSLIDLSSVTGVAYKKLSDLKKSIPLSSVKQKKLHQWIDTALQQNYLLKAQLNTMLASGQSIRVAQAAKVPTLNLVGSYGNTETPISNGTHITGTAKQNNATVGLNLNFPIFRGGYDIVNTKQKRYQYLSASDQVNVTKNQVIEDTSKAFYAVESGKSQINADLQALKASKASLQATKNSYETGLRTMTDVLNAVSNLAKVKLAYANDRYNYVQSLAELKLATGTLSPKDINLLNTWLSSTPIKKSIEKKIKTPKETKTDKA